MHESREERALRRSASAALASVGGLPRSASLVFSILASGGSAVAAGGAAADVVRAAVSSSLSRAGLVRSEYEQEQMLKELLANEAQAARIAKGGCAVPSMLTARRDEDARTALVAQGAAGAAAAATAVARARAASARARPRPTCTARTPRGSPRSGSARTPRGGVGALTSATSGALDASRVLDARAEERERSTRSPWSDLEKCVFLDKFLQYPKNFGKIAQFLRLKTAKDCVAFYYDSKKDIEYKALLREHQQRRRGVRVCWDATSRAARACGAELEHDERSGAVHFRLPPHAHSYSTARAHPRARARRRSSRGASRSTRARSTSAATSSARPTPRAARARAAATAARAAASTAARAARASARRASAAGRRGPRPQRQAAAGRRGGRRRAAAQAHGGRRRARRARARAS